jgi:hypothetical protein
LLALVAIPALAAPEASAIRRPVDHVGFGLALTNACLRAADTYAVLNERVDAEGDRGVVAFLNDLDPLLESFRGRLRAITPAEATDVRLQRDLEAIIQRERALLPGLRRLAVRGDFVRYRAQSAARYAPIIAAYESVQNRLVLSGLDPCDFLPPATVDPAEPI